MIRENEPGPVAIVDHGLGNMLSVRLACERVGLPARLSSDPSFIANAPAVILPGVGAFGKAVEGLQGSGLIKAIERFVETGRPLVGICLGLQLFMTESYEFGRHPGFGFFEGPVVRLEPKTEDGRRLKVPRVGWDVVHFETDGRNDGVAAKLLNGVPDGVHMYFLHSYVASPARSDVVVGTTRHGETTIPAVLGRSNLAAFQFHPERSGETGLRIYRNLRGIVAV